MSEYRNEEGLLFRVGKIPYLNCEPYYHGFTPRPHWQFIEAAPSRLGQLAREWNIEAAPIPAAAYLDYEVQKEYELLGSLGIAARTRVGSVCLFSKFPIEKLGGKKVHLTGESTTSAGLVKILLKNRYGVEADYSAGSREASDAYLLIGDEALKQMLDPPDSYPEVYDLAELWAEWKGLPFVFAVWVNKIGIPADLKLFIEKRLRACWMDTMRNLDTLAPEFAAKHGIPAPIVVEYLSNLRYHLGKEEQRGLHEYARELGSFRGTPLASNY